MSINHRERQPEITEAQWQDAEGNEVHENVLGEPVTLAVQAKDLKDKTPVTFKIYYEGADTTTDKPLKVIEAKVDSSKAQAVFNLEEVQVAPVPKIDEAMYRYYREQGYRIPREEFETYDRDSWIQKKPRYIYTASARGCADAASEAIEVSKTLMIKFTDPWGKPVEGKKIKVTESDGTEHEGFTNEKGIVVFTGLIPAGVEIDTGSSNSVLRPLPREDFE